PHDKRFGRSTLIVIDEIINVPAKCGNIPNCLGSMSADHFVPNRKSNIGISLKKFTVSDNNVITIPIVVKTDTIAHKNSSIGMILLSMLTRLFLNGLLLDFVLSIVVSCLFGILFASPIVYNSLTY